MKITIQGSIPSKKNSRNIFVRGGRIVNIPQTNYKTWSEDAYKQLSGVKEIKNIQEVHLEFYPKDRRKFDLTNKAESIMDVLVDCGIIEDDNYSVIPKVVLVFGEVDKENPRCIITFK